MTLSESDKEWIRRELADRLGREAEVRKVVIFGSFLSNPEPHDLDVAVFQDSDESYLPLALKYRKILRPLAQRLALDVLPFRANGPNGWFVRNEVLSGETIYER